MSDSEDLRAERARLESIASAAAYELGSNGAAAHYAAQIFARHWRGRRALELGPAEGMISGHLLEAFSEVTLVDASSEYCGLLARRFPGATVVCSLFEDYEAGSLYDCIVLGHVLEHVDDPGLLLTRISKWLSPAGLLFAAVPNAHSLHRQLGVLMGTLASEYAMTARDYEIGHRRVFGRDSLYALFRSAGYHVAASGGYWLKPLSTGQIDRDWSPDLLDAAFRLGEQYPDIAAEIYIVASAK